jgi:pimeloyl-ACP methyl ester carboxylesterase
MREFQKVLHELKDVVAQHRPGDILEPPPSLPSIIVGGRRLAYAAMGQSQHENSNAPPVVLLHGFGGFFMDWPRVMAPLARHTRVYALDIPGWGFSDHNPLANSLEDEVHLLNHFLAHMELKDVILCGISYGAGIAWAAAAMHLKRVQRAVLLNPMPPNPLRFLRSPIYRSIFFLNAFPGISRFGHKLFNKAQYKIICRENLLNDRLLDSFYLDLAYLVIKQPKMPQIIRAHSEGAHAVNWRSWEKHLGAIRMPVSILQGREDRIFSLDSATYLHRLIPTSELVEVADCGHAMVFDQHRKASDFLIRQVHRAKEKNEHFQKDLLKKIK